MFTKAGPHISPAPAMTSFCCLVHLRSMVSNQELPGHTVKIQAWLIWPPQQLSHCLLTAKVRKQSSAGIPRPPLRREETEIQNTSGCGHSCLLGLTHPAMLPSPTELWGPKSHRATQGQEWLPPEPWLSNILELLCHKVKLEPARATGVLPRDIPWLSRAPAQHLRCKASKST